MHVAWIEIHGAGGMIFGRALAFTADPSHPHYAGHLGIVVIGDCRP
jgi:hypothetical protein